MRIEEEINQTKPFPNPQTKAIVNLNFTASWLSGVQTEILKPYGISIQQYNILRILKGMHPKPATVKILIERMIDKNSNASRLVDKLLKKGLLERNTCPRDRRRVDVMVTEAGLEVINVVARALKKSKTLMRLTNEEAIQLSDLLDKMRSTDT
ncbi:MAG: Regulatory protein MarR [uncultured Aureispira sp.]|uniref:Regulatory protein MarR n=1 Tax=uncultured Aureispira sp. TaxID=1331704 RepID=A0A6S6UGV8_9BACT|nr:MAG: Regulatory protein MarR [uncultured Aureispira sp.]